MNDALDCIVGKYKIDLNKKSPIEIPDVGRDNLAHLFAELGYKRGVELGVERGAYTEVLCKANPHATIIGIDAWKAYKGYRDHVTQSKLDGFYQETLERMQKYNCFFLREYSMDALSNFKDEELDFVYIDANHEFPYVANDIIEWSKKVRNGGIVSGHDYRKSRRSNTRNHVVYVVDAYTLSYRIKPWFLLGSKAKIPGQVRDEARSWFWVKG